jgi:hypothetical protein
MAAPKIRNNVIRCHIKHGHLMTLFLILGAAMFYMTSYDIIFYFRDCHILYDILLHYFLFP